MRLPRLEQRVGTGGIERRPFQSQSCVRSVFVLATVGPLWVCSLCAVILYIYCRAGTPIVLPIGSAWHRTPALLEGTVVCARQSHTCGSILPTSFLQGRGQAGSNANDSPYSNSHRVLYRRSLAIIVRTGTGAKFQSPEGDCRAGEPRDGSRSWVPEGRAQGPRDPPRRVDEPHPRVENSGSFSVAEELAVAAAASPRRKGRIASPTMYQQYQQYAQPQQSHAQPVLSQPSRHLSLDSNSNNNNNNLTWNGTAWVSANPPSGSSAVSSFSTASSHHHYVPSQLSQTPSQYPAQQQSLMPSSSAQSAVSLVQQYTQYYHAWTAQQQGHVAHARTYTPHSPDYQTAMQHAGTCQTYAEDSSRAAHYFHQNPQATIATAPLSLPPAPPTTATTATTAVATTTTSHAPNNPPRVQQPHTIPQKTPTTATAKPPMKDYVDRCLQQCRNETEKRAMVSEIERLMSGLIQKGTFHDMEWGNLQLIAVPERNSVPATPSLRPTHPYQGPTRNDVSYYGPTNVQAGHPSSAAGASPQSLRNPKKRRFSVQTPSVTVDPTINYYGPSITHNSTHSFSSSQQQQTSKSRQKDGFNQSSLALDVRARRFSGPGGIDDIQQTTTQAISGFDRFMGKAAIGGSTKPLDEEDYEAMTVKGTCHVLEKSYLRLTAPPRAELVRPEQVLRKHVAQLKTERQKPAATRRDYLWFCSQLKAVRQDCTVQRIQNAFTVDVYETHARIALEEGDLNEYNQCQTQLKYLYDLLRNDSDEYLAAQQYEDEFLAYRVLYYVFLTGNQSYQGGSSDLLHLLLQLSGPDRSSHPSIAHALKVRAACAQTDYHDFFRLRETCPNHGKYLMDRMVPSMRFKALQRICQAYRPSVETGFALKELGFEKNATIGKQWLKSCGCVLDDDESIIDTKESIVRESDLEHKQSLI